MLDAGRILPKEIRMGPVPHQADVGRPVASRLRRARPDLRTAITSSREP
jgi:hypothetical protein